MNIAHAVGWAVLTLAVLPFIQGVILGKFGIYSWHSYVKQGVWILSFLIALAVFLLTL